MKKKYRNKLPKGVRIKQTVTYVENGDLVAEVEFEDVFQPKDGDFLHDKYYDITVIYKETSKTGGIVTYVGINKNNIVPKTGLGFGMTKEFRYATEEEKTNFLERLEKEYHLRWSAETKKLEPIRWRAEFNEIYFVVTNSDERDSFIVKEKKECFSIFDEENYQLNNYFRTPEAAQKVADQIINIFKNSKAE